MNYKRLITASIILISVYTLFWWVLNNKIIGGYFEDIVLYMNASEGMGYNSLQAYATYQTLSYLVFLNFCLPFENINILIKTTRANYIRKRTLYILSISMLFASLFVLVNVAMTSLFFNIEYLIENNFYYASLFAFISLFAFYAIVGHIMKILSDITKNNITGIIITFFLIAALYYIVRPNFTLWTPINDLTMYEDIMGRSQNLIIVMAVYLRLSALVIGLYLLSQVIYKEKDILSNGY